MKNDMTKAQNIKGVVSEGKNMIANLKVGTDSARYSAETARNYLKNFSNNN